MYTFTINEYHDWYILKEILKKNYFKNFVSDSFQTNNESQYKVTEWKLLITSTFAATLHHLIGTLNLLICLNLKFFSLFSWSLEKKCCLWAYIVLSNFKVQSITCFDATNSAHCLPNVFTLKNKCFKNSFLVFIWVLCNEIY